MSQQNNHHTLVALDDVLGALVEDGPLSSEELAQQLGLTRLDARMVLVDAHAHGLVQTNHRGEWKITEPGREALMPPGHQPRRPQPAWHARLRPTYLGRRGLPIAVALAVSAGGVAVANSGLPSFSGPPVVVATHAKARHHARRRHTVNRLRPHFYYTATGRRHHTPRTRLVGTVRLTRHLPLWRPYVPPRVTSPACLQRPAGTRVAGRRARRPALGDRATPGRHTVTAPQPARCDG